ncbi:hypothetical protein GDO78_022648 [Eleutherodactylus coqui]|uniref:Uncharacterized protein n=1 Tax=Eleutherodactylus coqui TaxID=57060 RepID=A0A8J6BI07_ELECQ|nr:hypothetical protein GDO78_022648 [Eleutherodactylus coqui]
MCMMPSELVEGFVVHVLSVYEISLNVAAPHTPDGFHLPITWPTVDSGRSKSAAMSRTDWLVTSHHQTPLSALLLGESDGFCTGTVHYWWVGGNTFANSVYYIYIRDAWKED